MSKTTRKPVVIELEAEAPKQTKTKKRPAKKPVEVSVEQPVDAPPVPDDIGSRQADIMMSAAHIAARKPSILWRGFWALLVTLIGVAVSVAFWNFVTATMQSTPWLAWVVTGLVAALVLVAILLILKEIRAFSRLRRIDGLREESEATTTRENLETARSYTARLQRFYRGRRELRWGMDELATSLPEALDAGAVMTLTERHLMTPLDTAAQEVIEASSRQVATATAIIPLGLADVVIALTANIRMIRRIAEIYGGKASGLGSWRLVKAVAAHLVATGAVAIGDDLLGSIAGGGVLSKLSRRFGEGIINGALTARVGIAAMEVCRPMAFEAVKKPGVTQVMKRALTGFFG